MRDRQCCSDSRGSVWIRTGLILGTLTTIIFVVCTKDGEKSCSLGTDQRQIHKFLSWYCAPAGDVANLPSILQVILVGYDFVISDELTDKEIAASLTRPENTDPFKSLGAVRSLNISFWGYCIGYDAPTYNNASVSVCFRWEPL